MYIVNQFQSDHAAKGPRDILGLIGSFEHIDHNGVLCTYEVFELIPQLDAPSPTVLKHWALALWEYNIAAAEPADGDEVYYVYHDVDGVYDWVHDRMARCDIDMDDVIPHVEEMLSAR